MGKKAKNKTQIKKKTLNPEFNEVSAVSLRVLTSTHFEISPVFPGVFLRDKARRASQEDAGYLSLGL